MDRRDRIGGQSRRHADFVGLDAPTRAGMSDVEARSWSGCSNAGAVMSTVSRPGGRPGWTAAPDPALERRYAPSPRRQATRVLYF